MSTSRGHELNALGNTIEAMEVYSAQAKKDFEALRNAYQTRLEESETRYRKLQAEMLELKQSREIELTSQISNLGETSQKPYVAVIIDGSKIFFDRKLLEAEGDGGIKAAQRLNHSIIQHVQSTIGMENVAHIIVMIFGEFRTAAKLVRKGAASPRALAQFAAYFNSKFASCNYIDTCSAQAARFKVRENFVMCSNDSNCKHIILGVNRAYADIEQLISCPDKERRLTLLDVKRPQQQYKKLGLRSVNFDGVFRWDSMANSDRFLIQDQDGIVWRFADHELKPCYGVRVCDCYQKGSCTKPNCEFDHVSLTAENPYSLPEGGPEGLIPVNKNNERIDQFIRLPTSTEWEAYNVRQEIDPCLDFQLTGKPCEDPACSKDHEPYGQAALHTLRYRAIGALVCKQKGQCRQLGCYKGHHCHNYYCLESRSQNCAWSVSIHEIDTTIARWVEADKGSLMGETSAHDGLVSMNEEPSRNDSAPESSETTPMEITYNLIDL